MLDGHGGNQGKAARKGLYITGLIAAFLYLIGAELIWLPAPIVTGDGMEWIEWIDYLYYGLAIVPICWLAGALLRYKEDIGNARSPLYLKLLRGALAAASLVSVFLVAFAPGMLELQLGAIALCALLMFCDLIVSEIATTRRRRFPWRSAALIAGTAALLALLAWPTSYQVTYPGMTLNLNRYAEVEGGAGAS